MREMAAAAETSGWPLPDRELAYAPIKSDLGQRYLGAMRCAINCAFANREIIGNLTRRVFGAVVEATEAAGLARKVASLAPIICIKG
jgi:tRNA-splicing ligase RtcB